MLLWYTLTVSKWKESVNDYCIFSIISSASFSFLSSTSSINLILCEKLDLHVTFILNDDGLGLLSLSVSGVLVPFLKRVVMMLLYITNSVSGSAVSSAISQDYSSCIIIVFIHKISDLTR